jgi:hypothetical protein
LKQILFFSSNFIPTPNQFLEPKKDLHKHFSKKILMMISRVRIFHLIFSAESLLWNVEKTLFYLNISSRGVGCGGGWGTEF